MMSYYNIARDCEERHALTYFSFPLTNETEIASDNRRFVMQSLFSRADTGLLKEDSSSTLPNDIISKIPKMGINT